MSSLFIKNAGPIQVARLHMYDTVLYRTAWYCWCGPGRNECRLLGRGRDRKSEEVATYPVTGENSPSMHGGVARLSMAKTESVDLEPGDGTPCRVRIREQ